jgi:O-antigen/teichoic acid export membrane protein
MNILRNFSFLTAAYIVEKLITFVLVIILARYLGVKGYGVYALALSFVGLFGNLFDGGLNLLLMREVAKGEINRQQLLGQVFINKIFLGVVVLFFIIFLAMILRYPQNAFLSIIIYGASMLILSFSNTFRAIFIALERAEFEGLLIILNRILLLGGIVACLFLGIKVPEIMATHLVTYAITLCIAGFICVKKFVSPSWDIINYESIKNLFKGAIPFGLAAIMGEIFFNIDTVMISKMVGMESVGYYDAAYKLSFSGVLLANTVTLAAYPLFSKNWLKNREDVFIMFKKVFKALILLSIAFSVTATILSPNIIYFVFGEPYTNSIILFQILVWSLPGLCLMHLTGRTLDAIGEQNFVAKTMSMSVVINVILNFILILKFKAIGASIAAVLTSIIIVIFHIRYLRDKMAFPKSDLPIVRIFFCLIGLITVLILVKRLNWILAIMLGLIIYFLLIIWLDVIKKDDFIILIGGTSQFRGKIGKG